MHVAFSFPSLKCCNNTAERRNILFTYLWIYVYIYEWITKEDDDDRSPVRQRTNCKRAWILFIRNRRQAVMCLVCVCVCVFDCIFEHLFHCSNTYSFTNSLRRLICNEQHKQLFGCTQNFTTIYVAACDTEHNNFFLYDIREEKKITKHENIREL